MEQSPSWEADRFSASQEIPGILRNTEVHYRFHKRPPPVSVLSQIDPVHILTPHLLKVHHISILPSKPGSAKWFLSLGFPNQNPVYTSPLPHTCYMPRPSHSSRFYHPNNIGWAVQTIKLLFMYFPPITRYLVFLRSNILLNILFSNNLSIHSSLNVSDQVSHPYKTTGKIMVLYISVFEFLDSKLDDKRFCTKR